MTVFLVGHLVNVKGGALNGQWRLIGISPDGKTLQLEGAVLPEIDDEVLVAFVQGPHGGLTVVHGGGNLPLEVTVDTTTTQAVWCGSMALTGKTTIMRWTSTCS
jgi:hypothetical protein